MRKLILPALLATGLVSCASVPAPLLGQFNPVHPGDIAKSGQTGQAVRWGGEIIKVEPKAEQTCFEILSRKLTDSARPRIADESDGRFIACRGGFYDPEVFKRGRDATVVGRVTGTDTGQVGEYNYTYPHVAADAIYLWPERPMYPRSYPNAPFMYDPFWGGPFWGYGPWRGFGPPVIVVPREHPHPAPPSGSGH